MTKQEFLRLVHRFPVAAALKSDEDIEIALASEVLLLFMLKGDAFQLEPIIEQAHKQGKGFVVHVDLVSGIGKDRAEQAHGAGGDTSTVAHDRQAVRLALLAVGSLCRQQCRA